MKSRRAFVLGLTGIAAARGARSAQGQEEDPSLPPRMVLRAAGGGEQQAALGTYCWGGKCVDMASPVYYPACPLPVTEGEALVLEIAALGPLRRLSYTVWPSAENIQAGPPNGSSDPSASPVHDEVIIRPASPVPIPGDLPPGLFVIDVFAEARGGGDTYQGFKLLVQPAHTSATPPAPPEATPMTESECDAGEA